MFVIATAGHVDHGKSALVRALTGMDPDRWAEEKRRGLTIDLGFAWCTTPQGRDVGIVDVPGHRRFIANMLAGVGSVPAALLVVDVNEGWRAQTIEHVTILDLLEVRSCVIALTKSDLADDATIAERRDEAVRRVRGTSLEGAPIVAVSAHTDVGVEDLLQALDATLASLPPPAHGCARLWVDRAFTIAGAGTVATGTLTDGTLQVGDTLTAFPAGRSVRVRALHRHGIPADRVDPVSRTAINLAGIDLEEIERGSMLTSDATARATRVADASLRIAARIDEPFVARGDRRIHVGTLDAAASITLHGEPIRAGHSVLARLRFEEAIPLRAGDRFIVWDTGRDAVVAGGRILDPMPPAGSLNGRVPALEVFAATTGRTGLSAALLADRGCVPRRELGALVGDDVAAGVGVALDDHVADPVWLQAARTRIAGDLDRFHAAEPLAAGMPIEAIRARFPLPERALRALLTQIDIVDDGATVRLGGFIVALDGTGGAREAIRAMAMQPLDRHDLEAAYGRDVIGALLRAGALVALSDKIVVDAGVYADAVALVLKLVDAEPQPTTVLRDALGTTRKVALPFLEGLDRAGITRFDGSRRRRGPNAPAQV
jgi:selenocysteine-specific elongation factor